MKTQIPRFALLVTFALFASVVTFAQEELVIEPEEITARLAPLDVVVEGLPPLPPPTFVPPLWELGDVAIGEEVLLPEPPPILDPTIVSAETNQEQLFVTAGIGATSVQSVFGDISLYRVTQSTRFNLGYDHRSADGFGFNDPGRGFFVQTNELRADVELQAPAGRLSTAFEGGYSDRRRGLQEQSPFFSVENRLLEGVGSVFYTLDDRASLYFDLPFRHDRRLFTDIRGELTGDPTFDFTTLPERDETFNRLAPEAGFTLEWPRFLFSAASRYATQVIDADGFSSVARLEGELGIEAVPLVGLTLAARGTGVYRVDDGAYFPVSGSLEYRGSPWWSVELGGGIEYLESSPVDLWDRYPALASPVLDEPPGPAERRYARGKVEVSFVPELFSISGAVSWADWRKRLVATAWDETVGFYPVEYVEMEEVDLVFGVTGALRPWLTLEAEYIARTLDRSVGTAPAEIRASLRTSRDRFEAALTTSTQIEDVPIAPVVSVEAAIALNETLSIELFGRDLISMTLDDGRGVSGAEPTPDDPFIREGLEIGALVRLNY